MSLFDTHQEDTDEEDNDISDKEETDNHIAFIAKLKSSRTLASILKTIHFADVRSIFIYFYEYCDK